MVTKAWRERIEFFEKFYEIEIKPYSKIKNIFKVFVIFWTIVTFYKIVATFISSFSIGDILLVLSLLSGGAVFVTLFTTLEK